MLELLQIMKDNNFQKHINFSIKLLRIISSNNLLYCSMIMVFIYQNDNLKYVGLTNILLAKYQQYIMVKITLAV